MNRLGPTPPVPMDGLMSITRFRPLNNCVPMIPGIMFPGSLGLVTSNTATGTFCIEKAPPTGSKFSSSTKNPGIPSLIPPEPSTCRTKSGVSRMGSKPSRTAVCSETTVISVPVSNNIPVSSSDFVPFAKSTSINIPPFSIRVGDRGFSWSGSPLRIPVVFST